MRTYRQATREGLEVRRVGQDLLILDVEGGRVHQLNPTAGCVWELCEAAGTPETIADRLTSAFDVSYEVALKDAVGALDMLKDMNLIVDTECESSPER
jgi:hypothetical protein